MSAELDYSNDRVNLAYTGKTPWHGEGHPIGRDEPIAVWIEKAGIGHTVEKAMVHYSAEGDSYAHRAYKDRGVLYRSDTRAPLSVVSPKYQIVQPREIAEFFVDFVENTGLYHMDVVGSLKGGRIIWALAKSSRKMEIAAGDTIEEHLLVMTSYDKVIPTIAKEVATRTVCNNTINMALGETDRMQIRIPHSKKFDAEAVKTEMLFGQKWDAFGEAVRKLAGVPIKAADARQYFLDVLYTPAYRETMQYSKDAAKRRVDGLVACYEQAPGQKLSSARGTLWGAVNAVTFYADHAVRATSEGARLASAWTGNGERLKNRAVTTALAIAGN